MLLAQKNLALAIDRLGDVRAAREILARVVSNLTSLSGAELLAGHAYYELGSLEHRLGNWEESIMALHAALKLQGRKGSPNDEARTLIRLASAYLSSGAVHKAGLYLDNAKRFVTEIGEADTLSYFHRVNSRFDFAIGNLGEAISHLQASEAFENSPHEISKILQLKARTLWDSGDRSGAVRTMGTAFQYVQNLEDLDLKIAIESDLLYFRILSSGEVTRDMTATLEALGSSVDGLGVDSRIVYERTNATAMMTTGATAQGIEAFQSMLATTLGIARKETNFEGRNRLAGLLSDGIDSLVANGEKDGRLLDLMLDARVASAQIHSFYWGTQASSLVTSEHDFDDQIQHLKVVGELSAETKTAIDVDPLLAFWIGKSEAGVWIRDNEKVRFVPLSDPQAIREAANSAYRVLSTPGTDPSVHLRMLARMVIWPILDHLPDSEFAYVVPHGPIANLPLHLLPDRAGKPIGEILDLRYPAVGHERRQLMNLQPKDVVIFGGENGLSGTRAEIEFLEKLFDGASRVFVDDASNKTAFLHEPMKNIKLLHIGSHAVSHSAFPDLSALIFGPLEDAKISGPNDSRIFLADISSKVISADLVVLGACETGLGKTLPSGEVLGFAEVFLIAGANNVLSTLWKIPDIASSAFVEVFYQEAYANNATYTEALRVAQRRISSNPAYQHPYYWAGWRLNSRPLRFQTKGNK